ncbi:MAG: L-rhamnose mutarotase [Microbacterium sp.]
MYRLRAGAGEEYDRRHRTVWPEMFELFTDVGIHDYTIWRSDEVVVCSLRTRESFEQTAVALRTSDVQARWTASLSDLFERVADDNGQPLWLREVFRWEGA